MSPTNRSLGLLWLTASLCLPLVSWALAAHADTIPVKSAELRVEDESYVLNAQFDVAFNPTLEEALQKGVSLYFVLEFEPVPARTRKLVQQAVQYRISHSP